MLEKTKKTWTGKKTKIVPVRFSRDQYIRIFNNAKAKGHVNISSYLRDQVLGKSLAVEKQIFDNNEMLKDILEILQKSSSNER